MVRLLKRRNWPSLAIVALLFSVLATCARATSPSVDETSRTVSVGDLEFIPCEVSASGRSREAECATYSVPENWSKPELRKIDLSIVRIPAQRQNERRPDPVVFLAGGPGQAASRAFLFADALYPELARNRDFYLIDQRGTGNASALVCDAFSSAHELMSHHASYDEIARATQSCLNAIDVDLLQYTTEASARDLDLARSKLALRSWNVFGVSYGTRLAYQYAGLFKENVRTMVLDSVVPPNHILGSDVAQQSQNALDRLFDDCEKNLACRQRYTELLASFDEKLHNNDMYGRAIKFEDLQTGTQESTLLHRNHILSYIRFALYTAETRAVLLAVLNEALIRGHYAPLLRAGLIQQKTLQGSISTVLHFAVTCAEDYPKLKRLYTADKFIHNTYLGTSVNDTMFAVCDQWAKSEYQDSDISNDLLTIPTLIFSGELDPITPPEYAQEMLAYLPNSEVLTLTGRAHSVSHYGCAPALMAQFISEAAHANIDSACLDRLHNLPLFLNVNGFEP